MRIEVLLCHGEQLIYDGDIRYNGGVVEIKTKSPCRELITIPLEIIEEIRHEKQIRPR